MHVKINFSIFIIFILLGLFITNSCKESPTEPKVIYEELRPFAGKWNVSSWLYAEIPMDTSSVPDSSDFILDCGYSFVIIVELTGVVTLNIGTGDTEIGSTSGEIKKKDNDEFILIMQGVSDTVTYFFAEDSTTLTYNTISGLDFSPDYRCNLLNPNPPDPVPAFLTVQMQKQE